MGRDLKLFFQYVTPSMAGMLIAGIYSIVDTFFVGIALHEPGLAAVTLTWPITMLVFAFGDMIGTGAAIIIAQKRGAGDNSAADHAFSGMIGLELAAGILLPLAVIPCTKPLLTALGATPELLPGAFAYTAIFIGGGLFPMLTSGLLAAVRNDGHPMLAMLLVSTGLISNIILDFLLVWVFPFGLCRSLSRNDHRTGGAARPDSPVFPERKIAGTFPYRKHFSKVRSASPDFHQRHSDFRRTDVDRAHDPVPQLAGAEIRGAARTGGLYGHLHCGIHRLHAVNRPCNRGPACRKLFLRGA